jgi:hypothetical protein
VSNKRIKVTALNLKKGDVVFIDDVRSVVESVVHTNEMRNFTIVVRQPDGKRIINAYWRDEFDLSPKKESKLRLALLQWAGKKLGVPIKKA